MPSVKGKQGRQREYQGMAAVYPICNRERGRIEDELRSGRTDLQIAESLGVSEKRFTMWRQQKGLKTGAWHIHQQRMAGTREKAKIEQSVDFTAAERADEAFKAAMAGRQFASYYFPRAGRLHLFRPDPADGMGATALA